jgi:hypothetical protein
MSTYVVTSRGQAKFITVRTPTISIPYKLKKVPSVKHSKSTDVFFFFLHAHFNFYCFFVEILLPSVL